MNPRQINELPSGFLGGKDAQIPFAQEQPYGNAVGHPLLINDAQIGNLALLEKKRPVREAGGGRNGRIIST